MGNTRDTGFLRNIIAYDASGNVGIGGAVNASYKVTINGTSLHTGASVFSGFVGINGSPATAFPLEAYINSSTAYTTSSRGNVMRVYNSNTGANVFAGIELGGAGTANDGLAGINGVVTGSGSAALTFYTRDGGTFAERLRVAANGNIGIGTSSLADYFSRTLTIDGSSSQGIMFRASGTDRGYVYQDGSFIQLGSNAGGVIFKSNDTERMRITSGGEVCVNRTSGSGKFNVNGDTYLYNITTSAGTGTLKYHASTGLVSYDGSARIFKKDIQELEYGLQSVLSMRPKKYKWKLNDDTDLGFIADEMYQIIPEIVFLANNSINQTELEDGEPMGINYDRLIPVLVKAIQELSAKVSALENK